ncbi:MAG: PAS domain S-box protein [Candidatus Limnocylindrales bacterium]
MDDARTDQLLVDSPHAMWVYDDLTLRFLTANAAATRRYGFTLEEFRERTILDIRPREAAAAVLADINPNPEQARDMSGPWQHLLKDGTTVFVEVASRPVRYHGRAAKLVWTQDVTKTQAADDRLERSEERRRSLFDIASVGISTADLEGNLTDVNAAFVALAAYPRDELLRMCLEDLFTAASLERMEANFETKVIDGVQATTYELELRRGDGTTTPIEVTTQVLFEEKLAVGTLAVSQDISYRKQLEEKLRQSQKMEAVGQLAGGIAHDFNNLLTAISGYSELALIRLDGSDPELRGDIEQIARAGERAAQLTGQLLAYSRRQALQTTVFDLNEAVSDSTTLLRRLLGEQIEILGCLAPHGCPVEADRGQVEQILMNLALNARDAMPDGGPLTVETETIQLAADEAGRRFDAPDGTYVLLRVSDTGCGMDSATRAQAFEPFFTTKPPGEGTGLGLASVFGSVRQNGGVITLTSEPGAGATFEILLPLIAGPVSVPGAIPKPTSILGTERILLVEDEEIVRTLVQAILVGKGYELLVAANGDEALRLSQTEPFDLLLTDMVMPKMSGKELAATLRQTRADLPVIYMSGYAHDVAGTDGIALADAFIQKPFPPHELGATVRALLGS